MKNQLLEDFGDSHSQPVAPQPLPEVLPTLLPTLLPTPAPGPRPRVWRARAPSPRPVWRARAAPAQALPEIRAGLPGAPVPTPSRSLPGAPSTSNPFASIVPDPALRLPDAARSQSGAGRRRVLGWAAGATLAAVVVAGGAWLYQDSQVASALALVANAAAPAAPAARFEPYVAPAPEPPPPMVMVPPGAAASTAAPEPVDGPRAQAVVEAQEDAPQDDLAAKMPPAPAVTRQEKPRQEPQARSPAPKQAIKPAARPAPRSNKEVARTTPSKKPARPAAVAKSATGAAADADMPPLSHAETLRQCRAAGYHASQCLRRGCVATRFGLACRG